MKPVEKAEDTAFFEQPIKSSVEIKTSSRGFPTIRVKVAKDEESCLEPLILLAIDKFKQTCGLYNDEIAEKQGILMYNGDFATLKTIEFPKKIGNMCIKCHQSKVEFFDNTRICMDCYTSNVHKATSNHGGTKNG